jgi:hypothetical protein
MSTEPHPLEAYVLTTFQLDHPGLTRLGFFLLAHVLIDTRLIALALFKAVSEEGGVPLSRIQTLADEVAERTFGVHLDKVRAHLSDENIEIAEEMNKARNALLHWKRDRFSLPEYKGQDVRSDDGFRRCMDEVLRFFQTVPFTPPPAAVRIES